MFPVLEVLVAVLVGLTYTLPTGPAAPPALGAVLALQAAGWLASALAARWSARAFATRPGSAAALAHERVFLVLRILVIGLYGVQIHLLHWPRIVPVLGISRWILVDELLVLAPFFLHLVATWIASYGVERRFRFRRWSRTGYVLFQLRQRLLPLTPVLFLLVVYDGLDLLAARSDSARRFQLMVRFAPPVQWAVIGVSFVLVLLLAPFLFRWFWGMRPLPDGPLRRRLTEFAGRVGFRARDILLWPTSGNVLNAAIIGLTGRFRYVMITDGLLASLGEDEIEAVFAHEVGHAKHRHMLIFLLFAISFLFVTHLLFLRLPSALLPQSNLTMVAFTVALIVVWWGALFGWISRRLETQADVYGATATAQAHDDPDGSAFISALENLAEESGQIRHLRGLRHPSIEERTGFLRRYLAEPDVRAAYRRSIRRLTGVLALLFVLVAGAAFATAPSEWRAARVRMALARGDGPGALARGLELEPGRKRAELVHEAVRQIAISNPSEPEALATADRIVPLLVEERGLALRAAELDVGWLLVEAARRADGPGAAARRVRHIEDAALLLVEVARSADRSSGDFERALAARASELLGRSTVILADGLVVDPVLPVSLGLLGAWTGRMERARRWLETAEGLEPEDGSRDPGRLVLRAGIEAREGLVDEALATWREVAERGMAPSLGATFTVTEHRLEAPLGSGDLEALGDWVARRVREPGDRAGTTLAAAVVILAEVRLALHDLRTGAPPGTPLMPDEIELRAGLAGPMLRDLIDPPPDAPRPSSLVRRQACLELARLYRLLARSPLRGGRDPAGRALWRLHLLGLAKAFEGRAGTGP